MNRFRLLAFALAALFPAMQAGAQYAIADFNPDTDIQPVSPLSQTVATGTVLEHPFAVRVVNRAGHPLAGVGVFFYVDFLINPPEEPDPNPPEGTYGSFAALPAGTLLVRTGADGVAVSPAFTAGVLPGAYEVGAAVGLVDDPPSDELIGEGTVAVRFKLRQTTDGAEPPDPYVITSPASSAVDVPIAPGAYADVPITIRNTSATASPPLTLLLNAAYAEAYTYEQRSAPACGAIEHDPARASWILSSIIAPIPAGEERSCIVRVSRLDSSQASASATWTLLPAQAGGYEHTLDFRFGTFSDVDVDAALVSRTVDAEGVHTRVRLSAHNGSAEALTVHGTFIGCPAGRVQRVVAGTCSVPQESWLWCSIDWPLIAAGSTNTCDLESTTELSDPFEPSTLQLTLFSEAHDLRFAPPGDIALPLTFGTIDLDSAGLVGSWANAATPSQGVVLDVVPDHYGAGHALLFGGWFTYGNAAGDGPRWYTLQGNVGGLSSDVGIYRSEGGALASSVPATTELVGTATITFADCSHGQLHYAFDDGRRGNIPISRLLPNVLCSNGGSEPPPTPRPSYSLAGTWADLSTSAQGFVLDVDPAQGLLFGGWYTHAVSASGGQRWYTLQGTLDPTATSGTDFGLFESTSGAFDASAPSASTPVGSADIALTSCTTATLTYRFTSGENTGVTGTLSLTRFGNPPPSCDGIH